jgi:hypothetical protein
MSRTFSLLAAALFLVPACSPSPERENAAEPAGKASPEKPAAKPEPPPAAPASEPAKTTSTVPPAIQDLKEKLQPRPAAPAEIPDDAKLLADAKALASRFVELCGAGDVEGAKKLAFTAKDFEEALTPGSRDILEGSLTSQTNGIIEKLATLLAGKKLTAELQPGSLLRAGASGAFRSSPPMLSNSVLSIDVNGTPVEVGLDQLVYTGGTWKIFKMSAP